jgi:oligoendopeptidase F
MVNGYYGRSQALAGNYQAAISFYQLATRKANLAGIQQHLALSQMRQGLAECYRAQGNQVMAEKEIAVANEEENEALKFCEINNTALSFAVIRKAARRCN